MKKYKNWKLQSFQILMEMFTSKLITSQNDLHPIFRVPGTDYLVVDFWAQIKAQ